MTSDKNLIGKIKKIFSYSFPVLLMLIFLYMAFSNINFSEVIEIIKEMSVYWFIIYLLTWFFSHVIRALRWKIIIKSVKENTSIINLFGAVMVGYGVNCVVPRLGELYRGLFLGRWENISRSSMVGTIIVERVIDILVLGISVLISVSIYSGNLYSQISWLKTTIYIGFAIIISIVIFLILIVRFKENFYNAILKFVGKFSHKLADLMAKGFHLLTDGFSSLKGAKNITMVILLSAIIMYLYGLTAYFSFLTIHMDKYQPVTFSMAWIVMTISAFGIIIPTPGAAGSYHLIVISVLVNLYNFNHEISGAFAILTHTSTYILFIISTVLLTILINNKQKRKGMPVANFLTAFRSKEKLQ